MGDRLKILMTADTVGGVWTYTTVLCKALQQYGVQVHLLTMGALLTKEQHKQIDSLPNVKLYETNCKLEWMNDPWSDIATAKEWVADLVAKIKPDIIHFNNFGQADTRWDCPTVTVFHSCCISWWQSVKGEDAPAEWNLYRELVQNALHDADVVVAPSHAMLEQARAIHGDIEQGRVIYNGSDVGRIAPKEPCILAAGRVWDEAKNIRILCDVAPKLEWPVHVAGNDVHPDGNEVEWTENLVLLGQLPPDQMQLEMARASIFVSPTKYEPFGLAILEAANAGCAIVLNDIPTLKEIWGDAASYFDASDPSSLTALLKQHISDEDYRKAMAAKASERAKDFTVEKMAESYIKIYRELHVNNNQSEPVTI